MKSFLFSLAALALCGACSQNTEVTSPDGTIRLAFAVDSAGRMTYSVTDGGVRLFEPSRLGFEAAETDLGGGFAVEHVSRTSVDETWTQPWGENKENRSRYNEMAVRLRNGGGVRLTLRFRVFDDGLGFRYEYEACGADSLRVTDELTEFRFAADGDSWTIPASFDTYELLYRKLPLSELADANTPATFKVGGLYGSIHEAALYDFPEMTLRKTDGLAFKSDLAPLPDGTKAHVGNKFTTAWRTVQLAPDAVGLINSSLILNLNEPSKIGDTSWIRPMKYVGVWWGMHLGVETWAMDDRHGATTENAKRYIDFAAANNIQGVLFEGWNEGWENWGGSQSFDFTKPYADFDIAEIVRYARERGIEIIGHHETGGNIPDYERQLERAVKWYADLGIHNLKTGYAGGISGGNNHHGQYMVRHYQHVVETAAKYRMTVNAHEPIKDCGIRRTWPNMMSREGARGKEWDAWSAGNPPSHEVTLPFTRLLAGPMDFTPGSMFSAQPEDNRSTGANPMGTGTRAYQMALYVVFESPLQMLADNPVLYRREHPCTEFLAAVPTTWDSLRVLHAACGREVVVARRKGDKWYVGGITNDRPYTTEIALDFLPAGRTFTMTSFEDGVNADLQATDYRKRVREVDASTVVKVEMVRNGGWAAVIE